MNIGKIILYVDFSIEFISIFRGFRTNSFFFSKNSQRNDEIFQSFLLLGVKEVKKIKGEKGKQRLNRIEEIDHSLALIQFKLACALPGNL